MTGLINIINQHSSELNILPIIVVMNIIISLLIHFLTKKKFTKFIPSIVIGVGSIMLLIYSISIFTRPRGLYLAWIAIFLGTAALVGIFTCFIIDLIVSIKINNEQLSNKQSIRKASKKNNSYKASKNKEINSKFHTRKISKTDTVKASRKKDKVDKDKIVFESEDK
jgi:hypothetical protein